MSLEAFLDKSILFGFSFGINKAEVAVAEGKLLGHKIGRSGSSPDEERCQAVVDFPPPRKTPYPTVLGLCELAAGLLARRVRSRGQGVGAVAEARG